MTDLNTQFTEHSINSETPMALLKNNSTRSVILCPFNTQQNDEADRVAMLEDCYLELEDKDIMIRFG